MVLVSWFDLCAAFSVLPWSLLSERPRSDGPSRPWPRQSEKSGTQAYYGSRSESRGQSKKQRFGPGLPIGETAWRRLVLEASAPVGGGPKKLMSGLLFFRADLPVDDRTVLLARRVLDSWAGP